MEFLEGWDEGFLEQNPICGGCVDVYIFWDHTLTSILLLRPLPCDDVPVNMYEILDFMVQLQKNQSDGLYQQGSSSNGSISTTPTKSLEIIY